MRLEQLRLEKYGHFRELQIDLPDEAPLVVIHGPNERGKTTLLHAIRDLFFGIPLRSAYGFHFGYPEMALHAQLRERSGARLEVIRRKGRTGTLSGRRVAADGAVAPLDERGFQALLGAIDRDRYEAVFGFTLHDLQLGAERLKQAGLEELVAGSALGGSGGRISELRRTLAEQMGALYKTGARATNPAINAHRKALDGLREKLKAATLRASDYQGLEDELATTEQALATLAATLRTKDAQRTRLDRLISAWPDYQDWQRHRTALAAPDLQSPLTSAEAEAVPALLDQAAALQREIARLESLAARKAALIAENTPDAGLLAEGTSIETLNRRVEWIERLRGELPLERQALAATQGEIEVELATLLPGANLETLAAWHLLAGQRTMIERLASAAVQAQQAHAAARTRRVSAEETLETAQTKLAALPEPGDLATLHALVAELELAQRQRTALDAAQSQAAQLTATLSQRQRALRPALPPATALAALPLPHVAEIVALEQAHRDAENDYRDAAAECERATRAHQDTKRELDALLATRSVPTLRELEAARTTRNRLWSALRAAWLDDAPLAEAPPVAADRYEQAVHDADEVGDRLRDEAESVARRLQLEAELHARGARLTDAEAARERAQYALDEWQRQWQALWAPCGIVPGNPAVMKEWHATVLELRAQEAQREGLAREIDRLAPPVAAFEARLRAYLGDHDAAWEVLAAELRRRHDHATRTEGQREEAAARAQEAQQTLVRCHRLENEAAAAIARVQDDTRAIAATLGFEEISDATALLDRVAALERLAQRARALGARTDKAAEQARQLQAFETDVQDLWKALGRTPTNHPAEVLAAQLHQALVAARAKAAARDQATQEVAEIRAALDEQIGLRADTAEALDRWLAQSSAEDYTALARLAERARTRAQLLTAQAQTEQRLAHLLGYGAARQEAEAALAETTLPTLERARAAIEHELESLWAEERGLVATRTQLQGRRDALGGAQAAELRFAIETQRAELEEATAAYVRLAIAETILTRVIQRYSHDHEATLFSRASAAMQQLTAGRYTRVTHLLDSGELALESAGGAHKTPPALSTGTREQLFLALRLAYIAEYAATHEPLPLVLDDALVDFDTARMRAALTLLVERAGDTQVLLLSCHEHVATFASGIAGAHLYEVPAVAS